MKCAICGGDKFKKSAVDLPLMGLPNITLEQIQKEVCQSCGEDWSRIPKHDSLMQKVTIALLNKRRLLASAELRWLRSHLGMTAATFAGYMMVSQTSV